MSKCWPYSIHRSSQWQIPSSCLLIIFFAFYQNGTLWQECTMVDQWHDTISIWMETKEIALITPIPRVVFRWGCGPRCLTKSYDLVTNIGISIEKIGPWVFFHFFRFNTNPSVNTLARKIYLFSRVHHRGTRVAD